MTKLYHIDIITGSPQAHSVGDEFGSNAAIAVKRALTKHIVASAKHIEITCDLSNHGEYDKVKYVLFDRDGKHLFNIKRRDGTYLRIPAVVCRKTAAGDAQAMARAFIDMTDDIAIVIAYSRGAEIARMLRDDFRPTSDAGEAVQKRLRYEKLVTV